MAEIAHKTYRELPVWCRDGGKKHRVFEIIGKNLAGILYDQGEYVKSVEKEEEE